MSHQLADKIFKKQITRLFGLHSIVDVAVIREYLKTTLQSFEETRQLNHEMAYVRIVRQLERISQLFHYLHTLIMSIFTFSSNFASSLISFVSQMISFLNPSLQNPSPTDFENSFSSSKASSYLENIRITNA